MDPQERLFIQSCWAVMEDAGYTKEQITTRFHGRIGVFAGISKTGFDLWGPEFWKRGEPILPYTSFGSVANRISYLLNLQGPSMAIDTMCSSSLTAIHEACRHLHDGSCDMAIAGGVNLYLHPVNYIMHCAKQMISKTNHCSAFGDGDGFVPGEGAGCVLLKPLSRAEQDGDHIYAVILGSHMNHNGKTNGYLTPNLNAQRNLILENCQNCGVDPRTISYVESAANGSKLGDPIEVEALTKAFSRWTKDKQYCAIGSVKSNIGHTEAASGIAQVTKVILQFQHQQFVPSIHAEPLNPNLDFTNTHFYLQREPGEWKRPVLNLDGKEHEFPRRAMINSFAAGGVNVNLILEEYISAPEIIINPGPAAAQRIIVFSARNPEQLQAVIQQMLEFVIHHPELSLADFAYTLQVGREAMASRLAVVIKNREELIRLLKAYLNRAGDGNQTGTGFTRAREALYTGNLENDDARMRDLLSGKIEETIIEQLLKENDFEKIACYWAQGGRIPWELFYKEEKARRISLPTYPFAGERYWFPASRREHRRESSVPPSTGFQPEEGEKFAIHTGKSTIENIRNYIGNVLVKELKIPAAEIKFNKSLLDYGVDSIASLRLIHDLKEKYRLKLTGREILEFPTIESFAQYLADMVDANGNQTAEVKPEAQWPAAEENGKYPLTAAQMGIWVTQKFSPQNSAYNVPIAVRIRHGLKPDLFKKACEFILKQYPILNTMILEENVLEANGAPYQTIHSTRELDFTQENIAHLDETEIIPYLRKKVKIPFELATSSLMRVYLFSRSAQDYIVLIVIHHIIFDGTSLVLLTKSLWNAYYEYSQNREPEILPLQASFADFVAWEREMLNGPEGEEHLAYWKKQLSGTLHPVTIPADHPRLPVPSHIGATYEARLSEELTRKMRELAKSRQVSLAALFLGIYKVFLYKYTGQSDIFVSLPVIGRPQRRFDSVVGMFINLVVIRSELQPGQSFADFLKELRLRLIDGVNHGDYPFQAIVKYMKENHNMDITGLIQVDFTYQSFIRPNSFDDSHFPPGILAFESLEGIHQEGTDEFGLEIIEAEHNSHFNFKYNPDLFDEATIERMVRHFLNILGQIAANPEIIIAEAELLSREEKARLLVEFNDTRADYPKDKTINELFEEQVSKTPDQTAVMFQDQVLSYRFVNEQSNRLAGILRGKGVKSDTVVGIMVERSVEMMIGLMAIFKAGGAYLPVDPGYPTDRINYMLEDGGVSILLIQQKFAPLEITDRVNRIYIDDPSLFTGRETSGVNLPPANTARSLAYVIYTSGSTGKPKGVMIDHYSLVNRLHWMQKNYPVGADDLILQKTPYTFDVSLWELFWWAVAGARVCFLRPGGEKDPAAIVTAIAEYQVTTIHFVPSMLNAFLGYIESLDDITRLKSLKQVFASGEALNIQQVTKFNRLFHQKSGAKLHNLYGPTEATVDVSYFDCSASQAPEVVPIGKPVDNIRLYILNRDNQLQPVGVPGELHIAGDGLARGYLNRPELTEEKFIPDPFEPGSRLYKTGDLARWLPDGNIEFLGRMDSQIKIRGFRIELGEIENQLALIKTIKDAAVIVKKDDEGVPFLVAYIVSHEKEADIQAIKATLSHSLPDYMIPSFIIQIEALPLSPNGKADKKALMNLKVEVQSGREYVAPRNELEQRLAEIFSKVLNVESVSIHDNFLELGGHSLSVIKVLGIIKEKLNIKMSVKDFYAHTSVAELERLITEGGTADEMIDLNKEAELDASIAPCGSYTAVANPSNLLLTGCSGFIGRFLLHELLNKTQATIYCLIRSSSTAHALQRIKESLSEFELWDPAFEQRIVPVAGDLSKPDFGIGPDEYRNLCDTIDVIYHCATYMNHLATYHEMKNTNVDGTRRIIRFACTGKQKMIQYISTLSIFNMDRTRQIDELTPIDAEIHYNSSGYAASKWVADKLMMLAWERGIPSNIYRIGLVTGDTQKGRCDKSQLFYRTLQSYLELGYVSSDSSQITITPVDFIVKAVVYLAYRLETNRIYFLTNPKAIDSVDFIKAYNAGAEKPIQIVSGAEFLKKIRDYISGGKTLPIIPMIQDILNLSEAELQTIYLKSGKAELTPFIHIDATRTLDVLKEGGIKPPDIDSSLIKRYFEYIAKNIRR